MSYAPSWVSQQLSQLEAEAGVPLLEPVGRRVRLTEQAEILVAHTEAVLLRPPLYLAVPRSAAGPWAGLRRLAGHPWVREPASAATPVSNPTYGFETTDPLLHLRLVEEGLAAVFLPGLVLDGPPETGGLRALAARRRVLTVVRRGRGGHPAMVACRDALRRAAAPRTDRSGEDRP
ncbi:LysR family transcriptional regulator [Streptomyces sp. NPDC004237]|uniref:LysR family transcriptional regulator n=1 Tax=Streptomyces sp. NPDC004237 TaxID=3154455 RepID=UPI0033AA9CAB